MDLTRGETQALHSALISAVGSDKDLEMMLLLYCGWNLDELAERGPLPKRVFDILKWCTQFNRVEELVYGATQYNPNSPELQTFLTSYRQRGEGRGVVGKATTVRTSKYASVYGITLGITQHDEVRELLGEPTRMDGTIERPVAVYEPLGLKITYGNNAKLNPHISLIRINPTVAGQLPHDLRWDMVRAQWDGILRRIYGPPKEGERAPTATYEPERGVPGNKVMVVLSGERIDSIRISSHSNDQ